MKKILSGLFLSFVMLVCITFTGCASANIDYDLVDRDTLASATIQNIDNNPVDYNGKTLKIKGIVESYSSGYYLNEISGCCSWSFQIKFKAGVKKPKDNEEIVVSGSCVSTKYKGTVSWYLLVNEVI